MLSTAQIPGRAHRLMQHNSHDFATSGHTADGHCQFGLVLDGCGSKYRTPGRVIPSHNEVGAKLLGQFAAGWLARCLPPAGAVPTPPWPDQLYTACVAFLDQLLAGLGLAGGPGREEFIASHLLCTLLGFVIAGDEAAFFWAGDGYLVHDGQTTRLESDNRPDYLAYHLLPDGPGRAIPAHFHTRWLAPAGVQQLAVATDGWSAPLLADLLATPRSSLALQRQLNIRARQPGHFEDDGAVACWFAREA